MRGYVTRESQSTMIALALALITSQSAAPRAYALSAYETQGTYIAACAEYERTGDDSGIMVVVGGDAVGLLECADYAADVAIEPSFREWYANVAKILGINSNPDDPRHCYDYRAFYRALIAGKFQSPKRRGDRFPSAFETGCHART